MKTINQPVLCLASQAATPKPKYQPETSEANVENLNKNELIRERIVAFVK